MADYSPNAIPALSTTTNSSNFQLTIPSTVYRYQVTCPRCKHLNWAELDSVVWCSGQSKKGDCSARIRVVSEVVDYEVAVVLG